MGERSSVGATVSATAGVDACAADGAGGAAAATSAAAEQIVVRVVHNRQVVRSDSLAPHREEGIPATKAASE